MLYAKFSVFFGSDIKLQLSQLIITRFLERTEVKYELLIALAFLA